LVGADATAAGATAAGRAAGATWVLAAPVEAPPPLDPKVADAPALGTYHLDQVDATNLDIRADGSYQWSIEGCDFGGGQCGTWKQNDAGNLVLESGSAEIEWSYDGSFKQPLRTLSVKKNGEDVSVVGETKDGKTFTQSWKKGRSCAVCGGNLGPTGQEACSTPLPKVCGGG
jgi:hypothetical protein